MRPIRLPSTRNVQGDYNSYCGTCWKPFSRAAVVADSDAAALSSRCPASESHMPNRYRTAHVDIADAEQYKPYIAANAVAFEKYGARFIVRGGQFQNPEGKARSRNIVLEFASYQAAIDCYNSPEYQAAIRLRQPVSTADVV